MKFILFLLISFSAFAQMGNCPETPNGINDLIEETAPNSGVYQPLCDVSIEEQRDKVLETNIIPGEEVKSASLNLKYSAINAAVSSLSGTSNNTSGITFSGDTTRFNIISPTGVSGTGSFLYADETCTGDCYIEFEVAALAGGNYPQVGLAGDQYPFSQAVAFDDSGNVLVASGGGYDAINISTYTAGDVFRVSIEGTSVVYYKNGNSFYTKNSISGTAPYKPMLYFSPSFHIRNINFVDVP